MVSVDSSVELLLTVGSGIFVSISGISGMIVGAVVTDGSMVGAAVEGIVVGAVVTLGVVCGFLLSRLPQATNDRTKTTDNMQILIFFMRFLLNT